MSTPVGTLIKERKEALGMSLKKLSEACEISDSEILKIESGQRKTPNWSALCKIAHALFFHPFEVLLAAGYITESDINPVYRLKGLDRLSAEDMEVVQNIIDAQVAKNAKKLAETTVFRMGELFCGPGGLAWGATHAVIDKPEYRIVHAWANDFDEDTCKTYRRNICKDDPDSVYCEDVHTLDITKLGKVDAFHTLRGNGEAGS